MRTLKFRAWDKKGNAMRDDIQAFYGSFWDILKDDRWVVMQYTGLKDKNGKEIYEGDILQNISFKECIGVMEWLEKDACFTRFYPLFNFEIIGNIYENPELINEE